mgnify:CR=1 FL=1
MKNKIKAEDLYKLTSLTQLTKIKNSCFFIETKINKNKNNYVTNISSLNNKNRYKRWTTSGLNIRPSSDGKNLFYLHLDKKKHFQLRKISLKKKKFKKLTKGKENIQQLMFSGDKKTLILKTKITNEPAKYRTKKFPEKRDIKKLINKSDGYGWYPNKVTYYLKEFNPKNDKFKTLFSFKHDFFLQDINQNGRLIAYTKATQPNLRADYDPTKGLFIFDKLKKTHKWVTKKVKRGIFNNASFSKNGQYLAIIGNDNSYPNRTVDNIWIFNNKNNQLKNLSFNKDDIHVGYKGGLIADFVQYRREKAIFWLNNKTFLFHAYHHGRSQLYKGNSSSVKLINDNKREIYDFCPLNSYQIFLSSSKQNKVNQLTLLDLKNQTEKKLYNPNLKFEESHLFSSPKSFTYKTHNLKNKKQTIEGWYLPPSMKNKKEKTPVILYIHGGPHAAYGETFFFEFQVLAAKGYGIIFINPCGSTTYGQKFVN